MQRCQPDEHKKIPSAFGQLIFQTGAVVVNVRKKLAGWFPKPVHEMTVALMHLKAVRS